MALAGCSSVGRAAGARTGRPTDGGARPARSSPPPPLPGLNVGKVTVTKTKFSVLLKPAYIETVFENT